MIQISKISKDLDKTPAEQFFLSVFPFNHKRTYKRKLQLFFSNRVVSD